ncbi:MAG: hypothetical protein RIQ79_2097 [Verrucomicrobiota bacterium]
MSATPANLVALWPGEDNALEVAVGNHGTLVNGTGFAAGQINRSFAFDGVDDRVAIPESGASDLSRQAAWTIVAWVRPTSFTAQTYPTIYSEGRWAASLGINYGTGKPESWINNSNQLVGTIALQLDVWNHVALTYDGTLRKFYVNGVFAGSGAAPAVTADDAGAAIGDVAFTPVSSRFSGGIDEVALYGRALGAAEVLELCNEGSIAPVITSSESAVGVVGVAFNYQITAANIPRAFSAASLPPGFTFNAATGGITGVPSTAGSYVIQIGASNTAGAESRVLTITVEPAGTPPPAPVPIALWTGDNTADDTVGDSEGTLMNGAGFTLGHINQAFDFDGVDDRVAIPEASATDLSRKTNWTIEAWVRPTSFSAQSYPTIYSEGRWGASLGLNTLTGKPESWINNSSPLVGTVALQLNLWNHVVLTYDGVVRKFYVNGAFAGSGAAPAIIGDDTGAAIGDIASSPGSSRFSGQIDEVTLYARALTASEVSVIYLATGEPPLITGDGTLYVTAGNAITYKVTTNNTAAVFGASGLPVGLTINTSGIITGTISNLGSFTATITATNAVGSDSKSLTVVVQAPVAVAAPADLVALWRAEDNTDDAVGINHGTAAGGLLFTAGKVNRAFNFNNVTGGNERVVIPESTVTDLSRKAAWTIEAWVKPTGYIGISWPTIYSEGRCGASLGLNTGTGKLESWINNSNPLIGTIALQFDAWNHVALTYDGAGRTLYVNGVFAGSGPAPAILPDDTGAAIGEIAHDFNSSSFSGQIDEVSLYARALTEGEISEIYRAGSGGKTIANIVSGYNGWKMSRFTTTEQANAAISGPSADPDADGIPNLLEYALDLNPGQAGTTGLPVIGGNGGVLTLAYSKTRTDVIYTVQTTDTLANAGSWTSAGVNQGTPDLEGNITASVALGGGARFLRLQVILSQ